MTALSGAQWLALAHLARLGPARCLPGQIWTSEAEEWEAGNRSVLDDYSIDRRTLESLARKLLVALDDDHGCYTITNAGLTRLELYHYNHKER